MNRCTNTLLMAGLALAAVGCVAPGKLENRAEFGDPANSRNPQMGAGTGAVAGSGGAGVTGGAGQGAAGMGSAGRGASGSGGGGAVQAQGCPEACNLMDQRCATAGCHDASGSSAMLNLATSGVAMRLTGVNAKSSCTTRPLLDPAMPQNSVFVAKISGTSCGIQMPVGAPLSASELDCLQRWAANPGCTGE